MSIIQREARENVVASAERVVQLDDEGHSMISFGYSNPTPWKTPREVEEDERTRRIASAFEGIEDCSGLVFNLHAPPVDSTLDTCPKLDPSKDPPTVIKTGGEPVRFGGGSQVVREAIERYQPLLSLLSPSIHRTGQSELASQLPSIRPANTVKAFSVVR